MDIETLSTIATVVAAVVGLGVYTHRENERTRRELKSDIQRLDDRVFALASGMKPFIERAEQHR